ncbi:MAG: hypothetical protein K2G13_09750, partial [Muribaculaceae bacterium]|nr:hypothetical protein [Muribaculaceae bacterium]
MNIYWVLIIDSISVPDVPEEWDDCQSELLRILYLIKNMEKHDKKSKPYLSGEYADIFQASSTGDLTAEETVADSQSYFREFDNQSTIRFASEEGREEGRAEEK